MLRRAVCFALAAAVQSDLLGEPPVELLGPAPVDALVMTAPPPRPVLVQLELPRNAYAAYAERLQAIHAKEASDAARDAFVQRFATSLRGALHMAPEPEGPA